MKNSIMEINLSNFKHNIKQIKNFVNPGTVTMPVIKANAYGTYLNKNLEVINDFEIVAVANVYEAIEIRKIGYKDSDGYNVEDFDKPINLMIAESTNIVKGDFESCVKRLKRDLTK